MSSNEKIAIAAHMHVLLRRKTGRVTDTEWMAANPDYAHEIVRFAREKAAEDGHAELAVWADKLELVMASSGTGTPRVRRLPDARSSGAKTAVFAESMRDSGFGYSQMGGDESQRQAAPRYIKGLR
jgi:hypothetical protein